MWKGHDGTTSSSGRREIAVWVGNAGDGVGLGRRFLGRFQGLLKMFPSIPNIYDTFS